MRPLEELEVRLRTDFGLRERPNWHVDLRRAVDEQSAKLRCDASALLERVEREPRLLEELAGRVTVGETHFFRHPHHFHVIIDRLRGVSRSESSAPRVIWSAGCASGEEPYSLAILIHRVLGDVSLDGLVIKATDLSAEALRKAREAMYRAWSFRGCPPWALSYFRSCPDGSFSLDARIRRAVRFEHGGLAQSLQCQPDRSLDTVLFRNVAIYLEPEALAALYAEMRRVLAPDGLLLVSAGDPRPPSHLFELVEGASSDGTVYSHRRERATEPAAPVRASRGPTTRRPRAAECRPPTTEPSSRSRARTESEQSSSRGPLPKEDVLQTAGAMADNGQSERAVHLVSTVIGSSRTIPALLLRGQLHLEALRLSDALLDLRKATYLAPESALVRFWYAMALHASGDVSRAIKQLREAEALLAPLSLDLMLEDGDTRPYELRDAIVSFLEELR